jgi:hypothetical protein
MHNFYIKNSKNTKLGKNCDAIYSPIEQTCNKSCALKSEGCYAQVGYCGFINSKLEDQYIGASALQIAREIAIQIDTSYDVVPKDKNLRLFVAGDSRTVAGTKLINSAIKRWKKRGGNIVWAYTHSWQNISRDRWDQVSILASIDSIDQVILAREKGYAPAIVVSEHKSNKAYLLDGSDVKWIPCPAQTRDVACLDCKLCFNADRLFENNFGIAFAAHGVQKNKIKKRLDVIR